MPHPYSTQTKLNQMIGTAVVTSLLDFDEDGSADSNVYTDAQERADNTVDTVLGQRFVVPFAGDPTSDAELAVIEDIATHLCAAELYMQRHPDGKAHVTHRDKAMAMLEKIAKGEWFLDATTVAATASSTSIDYDKADPVFAGRDTTDAERMAGW